MSCIACEFTPEPTGPEKKGRFNELLTDEELFRAFEDFLRGEYAEENLQFFKDCHKFEQLASSETVSAEDVRSLAVSLSSKYLGYVIACSSSIYFM